MPGAQSPQDCASLDRAPKPRQPAASLPGNDRRREPELLRSSHPPLYTPHSALLSFVQLTQHRKFSIIGGVTKDRPLHFLFDCLMFRYTGMLFI